MAPEYLCMMRTSGKELHQRNSCWMSGFGHVSFLSASALTKSPGRSSFQPPSVQMTHAVGLIAFVSR